MTRDLAERSTDKAPDASQVSERPDTPKWYARATLSVSVATVALLGADHAVASHAVGRYEAEIAASCAVDNQKAVDWGRVALVGFGDLGATPNTMRFMREVASTAEEMLCVATHGSARVDFVPMAANAAANAKLARRTDGRECFDRKGGLAFNIIKDTTSRNGFSSVMALLPMPSCDKGILGLAVMGRGGDVYVRGNPTEEYVNYIAGGVIHETGHVKGLNHEGDMDRCAPHNQIGVEGDFSTGVTVNVQQHLDACQLREYRDYGESRNDHSTSFMTARDNMPANTATLSEPQREFVRRQAVEEGRDVSRERHIGDQAIEFTANDENGAIATLTLDTPVRVVEIVADGDTQRKVVHQFDKIAIAPGGFVINNDGDIGLTLGNMYLVDASMSRAVHIFKVGGFSAKEVYVFGNQKVEVTMPGKNDPAMRVTLLHA